MRDKKGSKEFIRKVDNSHPANIRVIMPPAIFEKLGQPKEVKYTIKDKRVILSKSS